MADSTKAQVRKSTGSCTREEEFLQHERSLWKLNIAIRRLRAVSIATMQVAARTPVRVVVMKGAGSI